MLISDGPSTTVVEVAVARLTKVAYKPTADASADSQGSSTGTSASDQQQDALVDTGNDTTTLAVIGILLVGLGVLAAPTRRRR